MAVVIYSSTDGMFLGSWMGIEMWSRYDATKTSKAMLFTDAEEANEHIALWDGGKLPSISIVDIVNVKTEDLVFIERLAPDTKTAFAHRAEVDRFAETCPA